MTDSMINTYGDHGIQINYIEKRITSGTLVGMLVKELTTATWKTGDVCDRAVGGSYTIEKSIPVTARQAAMLKAAGVVR